MKTARKALMLILCAALLVSATVMGTLAYLTDDDAVVNTFTVGNIVIKLDESDVKLDGTIDTDARVKANEYKLMPGHNYTKDPVVHVNEQSESSWIFVEVENGIAAYESKAEGYVAIATQITNNGWIALTGVDNVYYMSYTQGQDDKNLEVFQNFKIADAANDVEGWSGITPENTKVNVTAYAVQKDGFENAIDAWNATFGAQA